MCPLHTSDCVRGQWLPKPVLIRHSRPCLLVCVCISRSVVSDSLQPHGLKPPSLLCPCNSPGKNTGVGSQSLLRGSSRPRDWIQMSCIAGGFSTVWATRESAIGIHISPPSWASLPSPPLDRKCGEAVSWLKIPKHLTWVATSLLNCWFIWSHYNPPMRLILDSGTR